METYTPAQLDAVISAARPTWFQLSVLILLGTGMRVSELCALTVDDFEDDGDHSFLKVRRGKGAKFRRVPVSHRLRREILRYLNHVRPAASRSENLLVLSGGQPVKVETCSRQLNRAGHVVAFRVHAHKFRHTFATTYLRNSGDIERLRKILGHTTYAMVMRYVHLDASDLDVDFDDRSAFKCPPTIRLDELCQSRLGPSISPPPSARGSQNVAVRPRGFRYERPRR
jgi:integrase